MNAFSNSTGSAPEGTLKFGNLIVGTASLDYASNYGDLIWAAGPNDSGFIIAASPVEFWGTGSNDTDFVSLAESVTGQTFIDATSTKSWLVTNGYWTNYTPGGSPLNGNWVLLSSYSPANTYGSITFPNHNTNTFSLNPNLVGQLGYALYINSFNTAGNTAPEILNLVGTSGTLTLTQGSNSVVYSFTNNAFKLMGGIQVAWDNQYEGGLVGEITVLSPASGNFNSIDPITITIS